MYLWAALSYAVWHLHSHLWCPCSVTSRLLSRYPPGTEVCGGPSQLLYTQPPSLHYDPLTVLITHLRPPAPLFVYKCWLLNSKHLYRWYVDLKTNLSSLNLCVLRLVTRNLCSRHHCDLSLGPFQTYKLFIQHERSVSEVSFPIIPVIWEMLFPT